MLWVTLVYHPYRFDGRVETALRGGLCLCWGVTIDQTTSELTASISTAAPSRTRRQDQGVPPALTGSASRSRLQGECPSGDLRLRPVYARRSGLVHVCHRHDHVARAAGSFYGYSVHVPHREQRACCRRLRVPALPAGLLLSPRQAPPSRPYPTRLRTQPRIAPGDPMATARQGTAAQPHLLSVHVSKRHLIRSCPSVALQSTLWHPRRLLGQARMRPFCFFRPYNRRKVRSEMGLSLRIGNRDCILFAIS